MKRWVLITVLLYLLCLTVLIAPLFLIAYGVDESGDFFGFFYAWFVPVLILVQIVLLLVPIAIVHERPVGRRRVVLSAVIGAVPMAALVIGFLSSVAFMVWGEDGIADYWYEWPVLIVFVVSWLIWGILFYRNYSSKDPQSFTSNLTRWLLRGSILELLVAIPSHIISRHRDECCAPPITLIGIATGLAIALMSFGPGVFFLFAQRIRAKKGTQHNQSPDAGE